MSIRDTFVARFGEDQALAIEKAAESHVEGSHALDDRGSDEFRYLFLIAVSWECATRFAADHDITVPEAELRDWALSDGHLGEHDGDVPDYLGLIAGMYDGWLVEAGAR